LIVPALWAIITIYENINTENLEKCRQKTVTILLLVQSILNFINIGILCLIMLVRATKVKSTSIERKIRFQNCIRVIKLGSALFLTILAGILIAVFIIILVDYYGFIQSNYKLWYSAILIIILHICWIISRLLMMSCLHLCLQPSNPPTKLDEEQTKKLLGEETHSKSDLDSL
jgi:hypothetical protein